VFAAFSRQSFYVGGGEQARMVKLMLNALVAATSALFGEVLAFGRKGGLDMASALEVIGQSVVASPLIEYKRKVIFGR
jgi:3-hydroxyisobutyrate dehydrogenase